jgi:N-acetylmuramoyl-L-alanine amidase
MNPPARKRGYGPAQQALAWGGLVLMLVSFVVWQMRPRVEGVADHTPGPQDTQVLCVVIDAGHGGLDSGAIRDGVQEKDLTLDVAKRLQKLLVGRGFSTVMTRSADETVSLASRAEIANREEGCVFVSIHFDKGARAAATGVQTFYAIRQVAREQPSAPSWLPFLQPVSTDVVNANAESQSLAALVQEAMVERTQAVNRGTRAEQFYVVANVRHPAVLVEGGFLSNADDVAKLATETYRQELALAISEGVVRYRDVVNERQESVRDNTPRS